MTWILLLALIGPTGDVVQIAPVPVPFASHAACNEAGFLARANMPAWGLRNPKESVWSRVDWLCVPTGSRP